MPVDGKNLRRFVEDITGKSLNSKCRCRSPTRHGAHGARCAFGWTFGTGRFPGRPGAWQGVHLLRSRSSAFCLAIELAPRLVHSAETKKSPPAPGEPHCAATHRGASAAAARPASPGAPSPGARGMATGRPAPPRQLDPALGAGRRGDGAAAAGRVTASRPGWRRGPGGQSSRGRTSWAKRSIASSATSTFSGTKSRMKCPAPTST